MRLYLYYVGRAKNLHANALAAEYLKRSSRFVSCESCEIQPQRFNLTAKHPAATKILLDPAGREMDSQSFARLIGQAELEARDLVFVVGGHDGLPSEWKPKADLLLSLSRMTLPHEMARAVLAEQIYRGLTILRGHPYPR